MKLIVTLPAYTLGKQLGVEQAAAELERQIQFPDAASLPAVRVIARLRELAELAVRFDTGGTQLSQVRSRHAHAAWLSGADAWFSVDDDNEATTATLASMLLAVQGDAPRIVLAPYIVRGAATLGGAIVTASVELPRIVSEERLLPNGARLRPCGKGGFGLVIMNRQALDAVRAANQDLVYVDSDGMERLALFLPYIRKRQWLTDDFSFFSRVPPEVHIEALLTGCTMHAGEVLNLAEVEA